MFRTSLLLDYAKRATKRAACRYFCSISVTPELDEMAKKVEHEKNLIELTSTGSVQKTRALENSFYKHAWHSLTIEDVLITENNIELQKKAVEYVQKSFRLGALRTDFIIKTNEMIMGTSGYRKDEACVRLPGGELFSFPSWERMPNLMSGLISYVNSPNLSGMAYVLRAAFLKLMILTVHPFPDGNGRTSRAIFSGLLRREGYPYVVIPINESDEYFAVLQSFQEQRNIEPYMIYMLRCVERSLKMYREDL